MPEDIFKSAPNPGEQPCLQQSCSELAVRVCPLQRPHVWRLCIMLETSYVTIRKVPEEWFPTGGPAKHTLNISAAGIYILSLIAGLITAANESLFGNHAPLGAVVRLMNTFGSSFCGWGQIVFVIIEQLLRLTELKPYQTHNGCLWCIFKAICTSGTVHN